MKKQKSKPQKLVTEGYLKGELGVLETRIDIKLDKIKQEIDDNAKKYRDEILTKLDGVMGELQTRREEDTVGSYQTAELRKEVDDHEKKSRS